MQKSIPVQLYLIKSKTQQRVLAKFNESIVDELNNTKATTPHEVNIEYIWENGNLVIKQCDKGIKLARPPFCPITKLQGRSTTSPDNCGISIAACILLQSSDNHVLLTRRASHMRSFPNVWVPPGGHLDNGEQFEHCGLRELHEETGLNLNNNDLGISTNCQMLGFWESVFPPLLEMGDPKKHHIVAYMLCKSSKTAEELNEYIDIQVEEADASCWVCLSLAKRIIQTDEQFVIQNCNSDISYSYEIGDHILGKIYQKSEIKSGIVISVKPLINNDMKLYNGERVSTGAKYALNLWVNNHVQ